MKLVIHQTSVNLERTVLFLETEWAAIPLSFSKNYFSIEILHVDWKAMFFVAFLEYAAFTHFLCTLLPRLHNVDIQFALQRKHRESNPFSVDFLYYSVMAGSWTGMAVAENLTLAFRISLWKRKFKWMVTVKD